MSSVAPRSRRARPVAGLPLDGLVTTAPELARTWLIALLEDAPLAAAPGLLAGPLVDRGPEICAVALRALADDGELSRLPTGDLRRLAHPTLDGIAGAVRAVDLLQAVVWAALRRELAVDDGADADLLAAVAERHAHVGAAMRLAVLSGPPVAEPPVAAAAPATAAPPPPVAPSAAVEPLWMSALADEVDRSSAGAAPLSLLLAELEDADRVVASASPERIGVAFGQFVGALRSALRHQDILVCEGDARAWVIARETSRSGAHSLGARIAEAIGENAAVGGVPLVASVGVAVLGEDGKSSGELIDAAEEARFAASARGIEVARRIPDHER